jgi:hypothetical protein
MRKLLTLGSQRGAHKTPTLGVFLVTFLVAIISNTCFLIKKIDVSRNCVIKINLVIEEYVKEGLGPQTGLK